MRYLILYDSFAKVYWYGAIKKENHRYNHSWSDSSTKIEDLKFILQKPENGFKTGLKDLSKNFTILLIKSEPFNYNYLKINYPELLV